MERARDRKKKKKKRKKGARNEISLFKPFLSGAAFKHTADCAGNHISNTCLHRGAFCRTKPVDNHFISSFTKTEELKKEEMNIEKCPH